MLLNTRLSSRTDGMPSVLDLHAGFKIFGHRGAAGLMPENTLPGFQHALDLGCRCIELDVHCTVDAQGNTRLCVIHDEYVNRTTNAQGPLSSFSAEALGTLDAGDGAGVPMLEAVFQLLPVSPQIVLNIELKGRNTAAPVARLLRSCPHVCALVSSFNHQELQHFHALSPCTAVAPLFKRRCSDMLKTARALDAVSINMARTIASPTRIEQCRQAGFAVLVYTVNQRSEAKHLQSLGAAGIFTDRPDRMLDLHN